MSLEYFFISVVSASSVSAFICYIFKILLEHWFSNRSEKLKKELKIQTDFMMDIARRKLKVYPRFGELIYRLRNSARDIISLDVISGANVVQELAQRRAEFENLVYRFRMDLERDFLFINMHKFKNLMGVFELLALDVEYLETNKKYEELKQFRKELEEKFNQIDDLYRKLIEDTNSIFELK